MAAVGTQTRTKEIGPSSTTYILDVTTHTDGASSGWPFAYRSGYLQEVKVVPDGSTTQPTDNFDVTLVDTDGYDLLAGQGTDCDNASETQITLDPPIFVRDKLDFVVANGGNAKGLTVYLTVGDQR